MSKPFQINKKIAIKDATLREGLDVPGVNFSTEQKINIARMLEHAGAPEIEVVAPGNVIKDLKFAKRLQGEGLELKTSGLIYAFNLQAREEIEKAGRHLNRLDLLMPVSPDRKPFKKTEKISLLLDLLSLSLHHSSEVGVGFPHAAQTEIEFLQRISREAVKQGAQRVTLYDTNGSLDPFDVYQLVKRVKEEIPSPVFFHGHNDLGVATANSLSAVYAGAEGLDVTVNGLGDRAGNASLEQVVMILYLRGFETGVALNELKSLSERVEKTSGIPVSRIAPVVGRHIFTHKSPGHLEYPDLFEAFNPRLVRSKRKLTSK